MLGLGLSLWSVALGASWTPAALFGAGQAGHWAEYNPGLGRVFQDAAGTTPVTLPDQPVGLVLDSALGGEKGPELREQVAALAVGAPPVPPSYDPVTGVGIVSRGAAAGDASGARIAGISIGKVYAVDLESTGPNNVNLRASSLGGMAYGSSVVAGTRRVVYITATAVILTIAPVSNNQQSGFILHSLREVLGYHAVQETALSRPTLGSWPKSGRRNLLPNSISYSGWTLTNVTTGADPTAPPPSLSGDPVTRLSFAAIANARIDWLPTPAGMQTQSVWMRLPDGGGEATINLGRSLEFSQVVSLTEAWQRFDLPSSSARVGLTHTPASSLVILTCGWQWESGAVATPYQRVITQNDITEEGQPDVWHLWNDGGDSLNAAPLPAGTYGLAYVDVLGGVTVTTATSDGTTTINLLRTERQAQVILRQGAFTAAEEAQIRSYWGGLYV